jgi:hypothetical protein
MTLERFIPGGIPIRCCKCKKVLKSPIRRLEGKPYCRECYGKRLGRKPKREIDEEN